MRLSVPPFLLRLGFAIVRRVAPFLPLGRRLIVTRYLDVTEVLARDTDFTIATINGPKIDRLDGPFILGLDRGAIYDREASLLHAVVADGDLARIASTVASEAVRQIDAARGNHRIDVAGSYARTIATRLVGTYFGVATADETTLATWLRAIFWDIFLNPGDDVSVRDRATLANAALSEHLDADILRRRAAPARTDDVLGRLLARAQTLPWLDDRSVRRNIAGTIVATVDNTVTLFTTSLVELLRRPDAHARAREAALGGDRETVRRYLYEAGRFTPAAPFLLREASRDLVIASGTRRARRVASGTRLVLATCSAMFDPDGFADPNAFDIDHDAGALHFGAGLHRCLGARINAVVLPELAMALVRLPSLHLASGPDGTIAFEGPFPHRLVVEFA